MLRTDFSDDAAWDAVCTASAAETPEGFVAALSFVSDAAFADMTIEQVAALIPDVENNLRLANMFFREFADHADPDGVFRGFPGEPR
ncbi:MAG TPA: hypothetical protein VHY31_01265 [Streptosporangiaceae bacterium]|nr:hypothetical protein [Streptosporangiaceae bacterium]